VEVYDYEQAEAMSYLVMRLVEGESLHALLNRVGPLPPREAMTIVAQAAHALHQAHRRGIVHRDVKPSNLLVRPDGQLVLTDFGIAHSAAADHPALTGGLIGTAAYLAPEQLAGDRLGPATDVYALGVVAYECLTLTHPFGGDGATAGTLGRNSGHPRPLPESLPGSVRQVVMRALARDPDDRWPSAHAMAEAATQAARGLPGSPWVGIAPVRRAVAHPAPTAALPPIPDGQRQRHSRWVWLIPIVAGVTLLMAAIGIALSTVDAPAGVPVPPAATVQHGNSASPQQTDPDQRQNPTTGQGDDHGGHGGDGGGGDGGGGGPGRG